MAHQDKALLEKAAQASGLKIHYWIEGCPMVVCSERAKTGSGLGLHPKSWNPLTNDGDALRLMAQLKISPYLSINIDHGTQGKNVETVRRSIVLAAASSNKQAKWK